MSRTASEVAERESNPWINVTKRPNVLARSPRLFARLSLLSLVSFDQIPEPLNIQGTIPLRCRRYSARGLYVPPVPLLPRAGGGNNENGCVLTTHTLIVNPVNVVDRAGASLPRRAVGDHPLIRSFASLQQFSPLPKPPTYTRM